MEFVKYLKLKKI